jgi:hypothetical protein
MISECGLCSHSAFYVTSFHNPQKSIISSRVMKTINTSYTEEFALGDKSDNLIQEMRLQGVNNFFYMSASFLLCWMVWQFFICWHAYQFGIFSKWTGNNIEFFIVKSFWTKYRITVTFLLTPTIFFIFGLFFFRLTFIKDLRPLRPLFTWMFLMLMTFSIGQIFVGFLFKKYVSYVAAFYSVPTTLYPILALPFGIIMALLGRSFETQLLRLAARQRMISSENKKQYLRITAIYPTLAFIGLAIILMLPKTNWMMLAFALTAGIPIVVVSVYSSHRFNFKSVKPYTPKLAVNMIILFAVLLFLIRAISFFGFNAFMKPE